MIFPSYANHRVLSSIELSERLWAVGNIHFYFYLLWVIVFYRVIFYILYTTSGGSDSVIVKDIRVSSQNLPPVAALHILPTVHGTANKFYTTAKCDCQVDYE